MSNDEFVKWLFPPVLTRTRKVVINAIMFGVLLVVIYTCGAPQ